MDLGREFAEQVEVAEGRRCAEEEPY